MRRVSTTFTVGRNKKSFAAAKTNTQDLVFQLLPQQYFVDPLMVWFATSCPFCVIRCFSNIRAHTGILYFFPVCNCVLLLFINSTRFSQVEEGSKYSSILCTIGDPESVRKSNFITINPVTVRIWFCHNPEIISRRFNFYNIQASNTQILNVSDSDPVTWIAG